MDITDDANTNSQNRLTTILNQEDNSSLENNEHHSQPPPMFNVFYHSGGSDAKYGSKKSLRQINKQPSKGEL
jgi:hypothetical protein